MKQSNHHAVTAKKQAGLSLIEAMVAMAIGVILMLGITQIFSASRAAFSSNEGLARIQENSRFAMEFIRQDLRMAGNMGCLNELGYAGNIFNHLLPATGAPTAAQWQYRIDLPVEVYEFQGTGAGSTVALPETRTTPAGGSWSPALPAELVGRAYDNSDVIVVRYLGGDFARLTNIVAAGGSESITVNPADVSYIVEGGIYGITDCKKVSLMQVNAGNATNAGSGINLRAWDAMESDYSPSSVIHRYRFIAYFIGRGADGEPALLRRELAANGTLGPVEEMVPGVESIQVMLGVNLSLRTRLIGDRPDAYLTAAQVQAGTGGWAASSSVEQRWASVVNFRVGMLIRNARPGASETPVNLPRIADTVITPPQDGRMRQTYEAQIAIRNRVRD